MVVLMLVCQELFAGLPDANRFMPLQLHVPQHLEPGTPLALLLVELQR